MSTSVALHTNRLLLRAFREDDVEFAPARLPHGRSQSSNSRAFGRPLIRATLRLDGSWRNYARNGKRSMSGHHVGRTGELVGEVVYALSWALGGSDEPDDLRLLCRCHNLLLPEQGFGAAHVAKKVAARRSETLSGDL